MAWRQEIIVGVAVVLVAYVFCSASTEQSITVDGNSYSGVVVAIREDLDMAQCAAYVNSIKDVMVNASSLLFDATDNKLYFGEVFIVVPAAWKDCGEVHVNASDLGLNWDNAHIRLGPRHPVFGDNPWTQQPRGCGQPGDFIYMSDTFLNDSSLGSQDKLLVHEWAKFRWGVFEEYGHLHDAVFPSAYRVNHMAFEPNYCSNGEISGDMGDDCKDISREENCSFTPDEMDSNSTVTSSLMSVPFLSTVVKFCNSSDHNKGAPTKHNLLCDKKSTLDVINQHPDMEQRPVNAEQNLTFNVVRASQPRETLIFLLDCSVTMGEVKGRWEFLQDSLKQFIIVEASSEISVGVVVFADAVFKSCGPLTLANDDNREILADAVESSEVSKKEKNLKLAIEKGVQLLSGLSGELVLVTENLKKYLFHEHLVDEAEGNPVWPILYPSYENVSSDIYEELANIVPTTSVLTVANKCDSFFIGDDVAHYQAVNNYETLTGHLRHVGKKIYEKVASDICSKHTCSLILPVENSTKYEADFFIEVLYSLFETPDDMQITVPSLVLKNKEKTSQIFTSDFLQNTNYTVIISKDYVTTPVIVSLLATPKRNHSLEILVWSSQALGKIQFTGGSVPMLFAMVTKAWSHVVYADVTAVIDKDGQNITLTLHDNGAGGDITGNDGVYSANMVGLSPPGDVSIMVTATDNNGTARLVRHATRTAPVNPTDFACCGSQLNLADNLLENPGAFSVFSSDLRGRLLGDQPNTLPPSQITDLKLSQLGHEVTLSFTAPGDQLDQGTAESYEVQYWTAGDSNLKDYVNKTGTEAGSVVEITCTLPDCDIMYTFTVTTVSTLGLVSKVSNEVRGFVFCSSGSRLSDGAIAGIVIGSLLGIIIIIIIVYLCLNCDHLDDLWLWQILTCRCILGKNDDKVYNSPPPRSAGRNDVIRNSSSISKPIRNLSDLYAKPNLDAKKNALRKKQEDDDDDDGGFSSQHHQRRNDNLQTNAEDNTSQRSTSSTINMCQTMPINQVGLPPASNPPNYGPPEYSAISHRGSHDNYGYEGSANDECGSRHPQPRNLRINTQV
ncbi:calcium-activated chloride channel regulator 2-like isoform X1 [Panulirus ornatus]|uniref:calcium-activated chloride channel regulator 2-like isoform X1 n=1 Tax=Panulirus ornatus TaxID=150431 RepID=UPI003A85B97F